MNKNLPLNIISEVIQRRDEITNVVENETTIEAASLRMKVSRSTVRHWVKKYRESNGDWRALVDRRKVSHK